MAEEELNYQINFDEIDLAQKLDRIRGQIDSALGQTGLGDATSLQMSQGFNPGGMGMGAVGAASMGQLNPQFDATDFGGPSSFAASQDAGFWSQANNFISQNFQSAQLGFQKLQQDVQSLGIQAPQSYPRFTDGIFQDPASNDFAQQMGRFGASWTGTLAGLAVGGPVAGALGFGFDIAAESFAAEAYQREDMGSALREIASQSFGRISSAEGEGIARGIQSRVNSFDSLTSGFRMEDAQASILQFANQGGFNRARSAEDMDRITQGLLDNVQEFATNMETTMDQAVNIMAQLEQRSVISTQEAGNLSARMSYLGDEFGANPLALMQFGMQGVDLTRGTGITARQGFDMAMSSRGMIDQMMMSSDPVTRQLMSEYATPEQAALSQLQNNMSFMQSGQGQMMMGALLGGYGGVPGANGSLQGMLNAFGQFGGSDINNLISLPVTSNYAMNALDPMDMSARQVGLAVSQLETMGLNVNDASVASIMMRNNPGMSQTDAMTMVRSIQGGMADPAGQIGEQAIAQLQSTTGPRNLGDFISGAGQFVWNGMTSGGILDALGQAQAGAAGSIETGVENVVDRILGRRRFRGRGVSQQVASLMNDDSRLFRGVEDVSVDLSDMRTRADAVIRRHAGVGGAGTFLSDDMADTFARASFGLSEEQTVNLFQNLQRQGGRSMDQISLDLQNLRQAQIGISQPASSDIQDRAFEFLSGLNAAEIINQLPEDAGVGALMNAVAKKINPNVSSFQELSEEQQNVAMSSIRQNAKLSEAMNTGLERFEGTDMRFRDVETAMRGARSDKARAEVSQSLNQSLNQLQESTEYGQALKAFGLTREEASFSFGKVRSLIEGGAFQSMDDLRDYQRTIARNVGPDRGAAVNAVIRAIEASGMEENLIGRSLQIRGLEGTGDISESALRDMYGQLEEALQGSGLTQTQISSLREGILNKLTGAEVSGTDATLALRELTPTNRRQFLNTISETMSTGTIEQKEATAAIVNELGGKIGKSSIIQQLTSEGKLDQAEEMRQMLNPGTSTEAVLKDLKNTIHGGAVQVKIVEEQAESIWNYNPFKD